MGLALQSCSWGRLPPKGEGRLACSLPRALLGCPSTGQLERGSVVRRSPVLSLPSGEPRGAWSRCIQLGTASAACCKPGELFFPAGKEMFGIVAEGPLSGLLTSGQASAERRVLHESGTRRKQCPPHS